MGEISLPEFSRCNSLIKKEMEISQAFLLLILPFMEDVILCWVNKPTVPLMLTDSPYCAPRFFDLM